MIRSYLSIYFAGLNGPGLCVLMSWLRVTPGSPAEAAGWTHTGIYHQNYSNTFLASHHGSKSSGIAELGSVPLTCELHLIPKIIPACPKGQVLHLILSCYSSPKFHVGSTVNSCPADVFNFVPSPNSVSTPPPHGPCSPWPFPGTLHKIVAGAVFGECSR